MASLNLKPTLWILAIQAVIFLLTLFSIKKLILKPFLELKVKRDNMTVAKRFKADKMFKDCEEMRARFEAKMDEVCGFAKEEHTKKRKIAMTEYYEVIHKAENEAKAAVSSLTKEIEAGISAERAKIPSIVKSMTDEIYVKLLS